MIEMNCAQKSHTSSPLIIRPLGIMPYQEVFQAMQSLTANRTQSTMDEIWFVQHPPVFTLGRNSQPEHLLNPANIPVVQIDRGGQVTYHGPGQLIAYLMIDLKRLNIGVREFITRIENSLVNLLASYDIKAFARKEAPGVYTEQGKIAALGLRIRKSCSYHGLSLNVKMQLEPFSRINPCGYKDLSIVQLAEYYPQITLTECTGKLTKYLTQEIYK